MKVGSKISTALAGAALVFAANAHAYYDDLDVIPSGENTHNLLFPGAFTDYLRFSVGESSISLLDASGQVVGSVNDMPNSVNLAGMVLLSVNIDDLAVDLYSASASTCSYANQNCTGTLVASLGSGDNISFTTPALDPGYYFFKVTGNTTGIAGQYSYSVAAVPEPGELAMMLSGLGLLGFMVHRRTTTQQGQPRA
ncbi:PEP-CTERM sorting domain-containing protein [Parasulfuritortus cantonensis]|uniref:PEP-CTERM sorting domain-containing protein n=1 Tax=Parasulfuritortus cantonensis TaxID=2528202 RepID=A0A4R1BKR7_9PROT|nr:FxDxF family PEP-CTERM protein [Parasulfuritortus cantonensis]TCJ17926.1 PEP-CTERM sorting domain-containing protein [Parasulfuritortus cantonensis]